MGKFFYMNRNPNYFFVPSAAAPRTRFVQRVYTLFTEVLSGPAVTASDFDTTRVTAHDIDPAEVRPTARDREAE